MRVEALSWQEYHDLIDSRVVVLPIGAIEAHGPHLPMSTDTIVASYLADRLAEREPVLLLPAIAYGYRTDPVRAGGAFPGMTNLRAATLTALVLDVLTASYGHGARRFLLLHGHIANLPVAFDAADQFLAVAPQARVMAASWWDFATEETRDAIALESGVPRTEDHHAALVETSLVMHMDPRSVRPHLISNDTSARRVRYTVLPAPESLRTRTGVVYRASGASPEIGCRVTEEIVDNLTAAVRLELG